MEKKYQYTTDHGDLQSCWNDAEDDGLEQECDSPDIARAPSDMNPRRSPMSKPTWSRDQSLESDHPSDARGET